ncbi:MAG: hypothetical protein KAT68_03210 [Bacteroidales bacterium]|nr:hypothetical protein [Bacteroidales bacterium]
MDGGREISHISFTIDTDYKEFYQELKKDFGQPERIKYKMVWDSIKINKWSKTNLKLSLQIYFIKGFEDEWRKAFIIAENSENIDLLIPDSRSYQRIKRYFKRKIRKTFK